MVLPFMKLALLSLVVLPFYKESHAFKGSTALPEKELYTSIEVILPYRRSTSVVLPSQVLDIAAPFPEKSQMILPFDISGSNLLQ